MKMKLLPALLFTSILSIAVASQAKACPVDAQCIDTSAFEQLNYNARPVKKSIVFDNVRIEQESFSADFAYYLRGTITNNTGGDRKIVFADFVIKDGSRQMEKGTIFIGRTLRPGESFNFSEMKMNREILDRGVENMKVAVTIDR